MCPLKTKASLWVPLNWCSTLFNPNSYDLEPWVLIQLLFSLINKIVLLTNRVFWFNVLTDFTYNIVTIMCIKFVVGSLRCSERFFSGYLGFPSTFKFQFNMEDIVWSLAKCSWVNRLHLKSNPINIDRVLTNCEQCESREALVKKKETSKNCKFTDEELSTHYTD